MINGKGINDTTVWRWGKEALRRLSWRIWNYSYCIGFGRFIVFKEQNSAFTNSLYRRLNCLIFTF